MLRRLPSHPTPPLKNPRNPVNPDSKPGASTNTKSITTIKISHQIPRTKDTKALLIL